MLLELRSDLRSEAIRMMRVIRYAGPDYSLAREFLSSDIEEIMESGLFGYSIEEGNVISSEGLRILEMFDPRCRETGFKIRN
jgi:hypothetical protein